MKRRGLPLFALLAFTVIGGGAHAQSTTFNVSGTISPSTCQWSVASDADRTVALDPIQASALPASGATGFKAFSLTLDQCDPGLSTATFSFSGTPDSRDPLRYKNSGTASGVAVELQSTDGLTIGANGANSTRTTAISAGTTSLPLRAAYWRVSGASVSAGTVKSVATVSISYN
ncbi:fimbrial protein [Dyella silvae]|uniref:fimbrial protein n=1 Tax=Dyella silvae TaxID=2994424 RepID=UPI002264E23B|nr:fimbrial protein [Dyella silvae]